MVQSCSGFIRWTGCYDRVQSCSWLCSWCLIFFLSSDEASHLVAARPPPPSLTLSPDADTLRLLPVEWLDVCLPIVLLRDITGVPDFFVEWLEMCLQTALPCELAATLSSTSWLLRGLSWCVSSNFSSERTGCHTHCMSTWLLRGLTWGVSSICSSERTGFHTHHRSTWLLLLYLVLWWQRGHLDFPGLY